MKNRGGYSLIELVVGMGLMVLVTAITGTVMVSVNRTATTLRKDIESNIDTTVAERVIMGDLRLVSPSYNNILSKDDAGHAFFDYEPEVSVLTWPEANRGRSLTLSLTGVKSLDFLQSDTTAGDLLVYDPVAAYDVGPVPKDFNTAATLTFVSLNRQNWMGSQRPKMWEDGRLLFLDTPAKIRPLSKAGDVDMTVPPKSPVFLGQVAGSSAMTPGEAAGWLRREDPLTGAVIETADQFLRGLPSVGGGLPIVRVRGVRWVRYELQPMGRQAGGSRLIRTVYSNGKFESPFMITDGVESLKFTRKSINEKIIYFKIDRVKSQAR